MRIERVTIENYKSFGKHDNSIFFSKDVIALVGKNGSGKSNWIEALDGLKFFQIVDLTSFQRSNSYIQDCTVRKILDIKISQEDYMECFHNEEIIPKEENVRFTFFPLENKYIALQFLKTNQEKSYISHLLNSETKLTEVYKKLFTIIAKDNNISESDKPQYQAMKYWLEHWDHIWVPINIRWLCQRYEKFIDPNEMQSAKDLYDGYFEKFTSILPKILVCKDLEFQDIYTKDELTRENKKFFKTDSALKTLLKAINVDSTRFLNAIGDAKNNQVGSARRTITSFLNTFSLQFNNHYTSGNEHIELYFDFDKDQCVSRVSNNDEIALKYSERSQGLKWYLSFFASLVAAETTKNALVLLDEPAIHLHVDAQKEVLELFENIAKNNIQIVYTTHSPALLNINSWESIRLVEKDDDISMVFTTTTPRSGEKHLETLSPIQKAMGCSLNNTIAPSREKLNLVVEGITDYYYLKAMLGNFGILGTPDEPYLIPACSADNIPNIVSIFIGWGYNYKVLLDNDRQGQNVAKKLKELDIPNDKILFVGESSDDFTIENLLSTPNKDAITICKKNDVFDKSASAFNFLSSVENKQLTPDNITKNNFQELFQRLGILKRCMENYK